MSTSKHRPPPRRSLRVREPRPQLHPRRRLVWVPVALAVGGVVAGLVVAATARPDVPRQPVPLATTATPPPPTSRTIAPGAGDGSYDVTDHPIAAGSWSAPGGARCAWSVRNAAGSTMLQGQGQGEQRVDLRAGLNFRSSGCGPWVRA